jgi:RNA polymerase sigma-70 factor, ECF subfamily
VTRAQNGETAALDTLIRRFQNMVVGLAASLLGGLPGAEDVAQEAFVEALRRLPDLQHPAAFPSLLQALVRKHADRMTRRRQFRAVTLEEGIGATFSAAFGDPAKELAVSEMREVVRQAVRDLPEPERAVVLLFYVGDQSLKEIAETLTVPVSTVKGRLHAARTRLKRRMFAMSEEALKEERPSTTEEFRAKVQRDHRPEYLARYHTPIPGQGPQPSTDWDALARERDAFEEKMLAGESLDRNTMRRTVNMIIFDLNQFATATDLMNIYLARPDLTPPERAEATRLRLEALCFSGYRGEYVRLHREFLEWIRPFVGTGVMAEIAPDEELMLWAIGSHPFWSLWTTLGHLDEWLARARQILDEMPKSAHSRRERFSLLNCMAFALRQADRYEEAWIASREGGNLSDEADKDIFSPYWRIEMKANWDFRFHDQINGDRDAASQAVIADEIERLVAEYVPMLNVNDEHEASTYYCCIQRCAEVMQQTGQHERAWGYYERLIASGHYSNRNLVQAAATLWKVRGESARSEVVSLLEMASVRQDARPGSTLVWFRRMKEFEGVYDDPEFVAATGPTE